MAAYVIVLGRVHHLERFQQYLASVGPTTEQFGGKLLSVADPAEVLEGEAPYPRVVLIEFPSAEQARQWKKSPEYKAVAQHRLASSDNVFYLID